MSSLWMFPRPMLVVGKLSLHHRDPFDRVLVAPAQAEDLILLTIDRSFANYSVEVILYFREPS
jgi:PIN domain nuclease of toxin-antitoxin system